MVNDRHSLVRGVALRNLAQCARDYDKNLNRAGRLYLEALSIFRRKEEKRWIAICEGGLGLLALLKHDPAKAERYLTDAQELNAGLGEIEGLASNTSDLGQVALEQGNFTRAETLLSQCLELARSNELPEEEAYALFHLARLREHQGRMEDASALVQQALQIFEHVGTRTPIVSDVEQLRKQLAA
jgi:tetratricopeptide (TPR) repeat protein